MHLCVKNWPSTSLNVYWPTSVGPTYLVSSSQFTLEFNLPQHHFDYLKLMNKAHNKKCAPGIIIRSISSAQVLRKMGPHFVCCSSQIFVKFNLHCLLIRFCLRGMRGYQKTSNDYKRQFHEGMKWVKNAAQHQRSSCEC